MKVKSESEVAQSCPTLATPWTAAHQAPPSMGFSSQKYWSGVPLLSLHISYISQYYSKTPMLPQNITFFMEWEYGELVLHGLRGWLLHNCKKSFEWILNMGLKLIQTLQILAKWLKIAILNQCLNVLICEMGIWSIAEKKFFKDKIRHVKSIYSAVICKWGGASVYPYSPSVHLTLDSEYLFFNMLSCSGVYSCKILQTVYHCLQAHPQRSWICIIIIWKIVQIQK